MDEYLEFWKTKGHDYITPEDKENPEGFDVGEVLNSLFDGDVLEVGCGRGRLSGFFDADRYIGYDINKQSLNKARKRHKKHKFTDSLVKCDNVLLYTVCLHMPDEVVQEQLEEICKGRNRVVIAEIMNPRYRDIQDGYSISNQRSLGDYKELMSGFELTEYITKPYEHYQGANITFAVFDAIKRGDRDWETE